MAPWLQTYQRSSKKIERCIATPSHKPLSECCGIYSIRIASRVGIRLRRARKSLRALARLARCHVRIVGKNRAKDARGIGEPDKPDAVYVCYGGLLRFSCGLPAQSRAQTAGRDFPTLADLTSPRPMARKAASTELRMQEAISKIEVIENRRFAQQLMCIPTSYLPPPSNLR
jgi:hypothetical protein